MNIISKLARWLLNTGNSKVKRNVFVSLASVVVFVTTYALILPAITLSAQTYCGKEEHTHNADCYTETSVLICSEEESEGHHHTDSCYTEHETLICGQEEAEGHTHTDSCYQTESNLVCTNEDPEHVHDESCYETYEVLSCGKQEVPGHTHSDACYEKSTELTCDISENDGHTHTDACYKTEKEFTCKKTEHVHSKACYSNPNADLESKADWEKTFKNVKLTGNWSEDVLAIAKTQLGYEESSANYIVDSNGKTKGYTRYGEWYGNAYGDWCAMFVSFCLKYAEVPTTEKSAVKVDGEKLYFPIYAGCQKWIEMLNSKEAPYYYAVNDDNKYQLINDSTGFEPGVGDLIFFNWDKEADSDHVGLVVEVTTNREGHVTEIKTIEGNSSNKVKYNTYSTDNKSIMGYAVIPANPYYVDENAVETDTEEVTPEAAGTQETEENESLAENEGVTEGESQTAGESLAEGESEAGTESEAFGETESESGAEAESGLEAEDESESEIRQGAEGGSEAESAQATEGGPESEREPEAESGSEGVSEVETESISEAESEAESGLEGESELESESESELESESESESEPDPEQGLPIWIDENTIMRTYDGADYHITLTYTIEAGIPDEAELYVRELTGIEYDEKCEAALEASGAAKLRFARFFDIAFLMDGEKIEPNENVKIQITCDDLVEIRDDEYGKAIHFAEDGTEILPVDTMQEDGGTTFIYEQGSFSVTGVSVLADDGDDGISTQADSSTWSAAPAVGNLTGKVVSTPVVGEWYIMYGYNGTSGSHALSETWPNRGSNGGKSDANPTLSQASDQLGGTVKYTGTEDIAWQYVGDGGFRNRYGYYMYIETSRTWSSGWVYSGKYSVTQNRSSTQYALKYSWDKKAFYTERTFTFYNNSTTVYSTVKITKTGYADTVDVRNSLTNPATIDSSCTNHYLAQVTNLDVTEGGHNNHPATSVTGSVSYRKPVLYNIDATQTTMAGVSGVVYTLTNKTTGATTTVTSGSTIDVALQTMPAGTYIIEQTSVPAGYVTTPQTREFEIDANGQGQPGVFYLYKEGANESDKTAQVIDYVKRIYQIELSAKSGKYSYEIDPINLIMVVDQSNSMLFPQTLTEVKDSNNNKVEVTLYRTGTYNGVTNDARLNALVSAGKLKKNTTYYLVTDTEGDIATSTVYAIFYDGSGWCYQDASYYSKAYRARVLGDTQNVTETRNGSTFTVDFASSAESYTDNKHGGSISQELKDKFEKTNDLGSTGNNGKTYTLYTGSEYNRLHELQQAVATLAGLISSFNQNSTMTIETFAKDVYTCKSYTLNNAGLVQIVDAVNHITTLGGTRQDLALRHVYNDYYARTVDTSTAISMDHSASKNHLTDKDDYVILITDGAPNITGANATNSISQVVGTATTLKSYMSGNDKLITVGLGALNVGGEMLPNSCSSPSSTYYKRVEQSGDLTNYFLDLFTKQLLKNKKTVAAEADIVDVVSDSFYITDRNGNALSAGTRIDLEGNPDANGPGLICYGPITRENPDYDEDDPDSSTTITENEWYVVWDDQTLGTGAEGTSETTVYTYNNSNSFNGTQTQTLDTSKTYILNWSSSSNIQISRTATSSDNLTSYDTLRFVNGRWVFYWKNNNGTQDAINRGNVRATTSAGTAASPAWKGHVYLKAKEDFIGGNTIDTNKEATISMENSGHGYTNSGISLPTPTVNVRLLEMKGFESEETVFLSDQITDIQEKIKTLLEKTVIEKIKDSTGNQMNYKEGATEENGCYEKYFTIPYAIRDLTDNEWAILMAGDPVNIEYTYDDDSSHGAVGYFTFSLTKEAVADEPSTYENHESQKVGEDVEKYTLTVTYTAYGIGESDKEGEARKTNVHNGSNGPGTEVGTGDTIPYGAGTESVDEIHHVHVIAGEIFVTKVIEKSMISKQNQIYNFNLYIIDPETGKASETVYKTIQVTVEAGKTSGTFTIEDLQRNKYLLKEADSTLGKVFTVEVDDKYTSCVYYDKDPALEFDIGTNAESNGTNPDHNVIIFNETLPKLEPSYWVDEERYVYSKPYDQSSQETNEGDGSGDEAGNSDSGGGNTGGGNTDSGGTDSGSTDSGNTGSGNTDSGDSGSGTTTPGTHLEPRETIVYDCSTGSIISTSISDGKYTKLDSTKSELDASHTDYGILTQSTSNPDSWTVEWHYWSPETEETISYDWDSPTIITNDISGSQYVKSNQTQAQLNESHTDYGILTQILGDEDNWTIEWHRWSSREETTTTPGESTYEPVTLTYYQNHDDDFSEYCNSDYYYNVDGQYKKIRSITDSWQLTITTTDGKVYENIQPTKSQWVGNSVNDNVLTYNYIYKLTTTGGTTTETIWSVATNTETADPSKIPTSESSTTTYTESIQTEAADTSKIPTKTVTEYVEVADETTDPGSESESGSESETGSESESGSGSGSESTSKYNFKVEEADLNVNVKTLSAGHGYIYNIPKEYDAPVEVEKEWDDGQDHKDDEVFVVLVDKNGLPVVDDEGIAIVVKLDYGNSFSSQFTVTVNDKDHNPLLDGYQIREVDRISDNEFEGGFIGSYNGENDGWIKCISIAEENGLVMVNGSSYNAHYMNVGNKKLVVQNNKAYEMPKTGGVGTRLYTMGGIGLIITALVLYSFSLRRRQERRSY